MNIANDLLWSYDFTIHQFPTFLKPRHCWGEIGLGHRYQNRATLHIGDVGFSAVLVKREIKKIPWEIAWHVYTTCFQMLVYIVWIYGFRSQNYQITPLFRRNKSHSIHESGCLGNTTNESFKCVISKQVPLLIGYILDGDTFHLWCYIEGTGDHLAEWALFMCAWCLFFLQTSRRCF